MKFEGKIALESGLFRPGPLEEALKALRKIGYSAVELSAGSEFPHFDPAGAGEKEVATVRNLLKKYEIKPIGIFYGPKQFLGSPDEASRTVAVKDFQRAIKNSRAIGCGMITTEMPPGRSSLALMDSSEIEMCKKAWLKSVRALIPDLERSEVSIAFEPHPGDFVEDNTPAVDLINEAGSEWVGNLYCFPHTFNFTEKVQDMIRYAGKKLIHCHVADSYKPERIVAPCAVRASPELTLRFRREAHMHLAPGRGEIDFRSAMAALKQINFGGYLSVQAFAHRDDPVGASTESLRYLAGLIR